MVVVGSEGVVEDSVGSEGVDGFGGVVGFVGVEESLGCDGVVGFDGTVGAEGVELLGTVFRTFSIY